jgi:diguanylate cyclase (GGDEF)-like protein
VGPINVRGRFSILGGMVALVVAVSLPAVSFWQEYRSLEAGLQGSNRVRAVAITRVINQYPDTWRFRRDLLAELLAFTDIEERSEGVASVVIVDLDGRIVVESGEEPRRPLIVRRAELFDSGAKVGYIESRYSLGGMIWRTVWAGVVGLILGAVVYAVLRRLQRRVVERTAELELTLFRVERQSRQSALLAEMGGFLAACTAAGEASDTVARFAPQLFPEWSGVIYLVNPSRNQLLAAGRWGVAPPARDAFAHEDCWALRRGQTHRAGGSRTGLVCAHIAADVAAETLCLPMVAQGELLGLLHIVSAMPSGGDPDGIGDLAERVILQVAEATSMAIANLKLRDTLRQQSIKDPLTNLYNRRYLEESLERELALAKRERHTVAVFMLDVDHFKKFNDSYGHDAGDAVLRALGRLLKETIRASDIACRFGGEEFTLILIGAGRDDAVQWAERLMSRVRKLDTKGGGQPLGRITISMGLALFPDHGQDIETLLQAADVALYDAKRSGRDRLVVYQAPVDDASQLTPGSTDGAKPAT